MYLLRLLTLWYWGAVDGRRFFPWRLRPKASLQAILRLKGSGGSLQQLNRTTGLSLEYTRFNHTEYTLNKDFVARNEDSAKPEEEEISPHTSKDVVVAPHEDSKEEENSHDEQIRHSHQEQILQIQEPISESQKPLSTSKNMVAPPEDSKEEEEEDSYIRHSHQEQILQIRETISESQKSLDAVIFHFRHRSPALDIFTDDEEEKDESFEEPTIEQKTTSPPVLRPALPKEDQENERSRLTSERNSLGKEVANPSASATLPIHYDTSNHHNNLKAISAQLTGWDMCATVSVMTMMTSLYFWDNYRRRSFLRVYSIKRPILWSLALAMDWVADALNYAGIASGLHGLVVFSLLSVHGRTMALVPPPGSPTTTALQSPLFAQFHQGTKRYQERGLLGFAISIYLMGAQTIFFLLSKLASRSIQ